MHAHTHSHTHTLTLTHTSTLPLSQYPCEGVVVIVIIIIIGLPVLQMRNPMLRHAEVIYLVTGRDGVRTQGSLTPRLVFHCCDGSPMTGCMQIT